MCIYNCSVFKLFSLRKKVITYGGKSDRQYPNVYDPLHSMTTPQLLEIKILSEIMFISTRSPDNFHLPSYNCNSLEFVKLISNMFVQVLSPTQHIAHSHYSYNDKA